MSAFKVNYAGFGKSRMAHKHSNSTQESDKVTNTQTTGQAPEGSPGGSFFKDNRSQDDLFVNFQADNMDYVNLLISKTPKARREGPTKSKISRRDIVKEQFVKDSPQTDSPFTSRRPVEIVAPVGKQDDVKKLPLAMKRDDDDGMLLKVIACKKETSQNSQNSENQFYQGIDTQISPELTPTTVSKGEGQRKGYKEESRRSMSMETVRGEKKDLSARGQHNRSTSHYPHKIVSCVMDKSPVDSQQEAKQSILSTKSDFISNLDSYIDYFKKSDDSKYKSVKAGQYLQGNTGKSHRSMQRELEAAYSEIELLKAELDKRKRKVNELINVNKMLQKNLQVKSAKEEEQEQLLHKMQGQITHLTQRKESYKQKNQQLKEMFKRERMQNENSLLSLKHVLSNNIKVALDHTSGTYLNTPSSMFTDNPRSLQRENDKSSRQSKRLDINHLEVPASIHDHETTRRLRRPVNVSKQKVSALVSERNSSPSQEYELIEEDYVNPISSRFEHSYDGEDMQFQQPYGQNLAKDCQIQFLKNKLAELVNDDLPSNRHTPIDKSVPKTSRSLHKKKASAVMLPSYYMSKDKMSHAENQPYLPVNYRPQEHSKIRNYGQKDCFSPNCGSERSFSLHSD